MRNTKRFIFIIFIFVALMLLNLSIVTLAQKDNGGKNKQTIKVAGDMNYPPYEYIDSKGNFTGYNVEVIKKIAEVTDMKIQIMPMSWENAVKALENRKVDLIQGMTNSGNRSEKFLFSSPILENDYVIIKLKENNNIESIMDLNNKKVSYQISDLAEEVLVSKKIIKVGVEDQREALMLLLNNKVDAFVGNKLTSMYNLQRMNALDKVEINGSPLLKNEYSIVSNLENKSLINKINKGISLLKSSGEYDQIYNKWFGSLFEENSSTMKIVLSILFIIFVMVIIIIFIAAFYNEKLKKKFEKIECEKENIKEEFEICQDQGKLNAIIINKLLKNMDIGLIVFDINGVVKKFNDMANNVFKSEIRIGDNFKSLNLQEVLDINIDNMIHIDNIEKQVKLIQNEKVSEYKIILSIIEGVNKESLGWMLLIKKLN